MALLTLFMSVGLKWPQILTLYIDLKLLVGGTSLGLTITLWHFLHRICNKSIYIFWFYFMYNVHSKIVNLCSQISEENSDLINKYEIDFDSNKKRGFYRSEPVLRG